MIASLALALASLAAAVNTSKPVVTSADLGRSHAITSQKPGAAAQKAPELPGSAVSAQTPQVPAKAAEAAPAAAEGTLGNVQEAAQAVEQGADPAATMDQLYDKDGRAGTSLSPVEPDGSAKEGEVLPPASKKEDPEQARIIEAMKTPAILGSVAAGGLGAWLGLEGGVFAGIVGSMLGVIGSIAGLAAGIYVGWKMTFPKKFSENWLKALGTIFMLAVVGTLVGFFGGGALGAAAGAAGGIVGAIAVASGLIPWGALIGASIGAAIAAKKKPAGKTDSK